MKKIKAFILIVIWVSSSFVFAESEAVVVDNTVSEHSPLKTSVQLWGVRKDLKKDFHATLEKLASMGFDGVEFAQDFGPYKDDPQGLKEYLESIGLVASGAHLNFKLFRKNFEKTASFYQTLGVDSVIIPMDKRSFNPDKVDEFIAELNALSHSLKSYGIKTGYHNHWQEFQAFEDATFWDYIARNTSDDVILQLDIGWVLYAEKDAIEFINKYPGRTFTTHLKPKFAKSYAEFAESNGHYPIIGRDNVDWLSIVDNLRRNGGTKWFVIEQEDYPLGLSPLEAVAASKNGFDALFTH